MAIVTVEEIAHTLGRGREKPNGRGGFYTFCPVHEATGDHSTPSLDVDYKDGTILFICRSANCSSVEIIKALRERGLWGSSNGNGVSPKPPEKPPKGVGKLGRISKVYDYKDEYGVVVHQTVRFEPKAFRQRCPNGKGGYTWSLKGVKRVLYHLPELVAHPAEQILVCEGEKDADNTAALGFLTTTNAQGAKYWQPSFNQYFANRPVVIAAHKDRDGEMRVLILGRQLREFARNIKVLRLPGDIKGDISDWLEAGRAAGKSAEQLKAELEKLIADAQPWQVPENALPDKGPEDGSDETVNAPQFSEDAVALLFVNQHGEDFRYVAASKTWYHWDQNRWCSDEIQFTHATIREHSRAIAVSAFEVKGGDQIATRLCSSRSINAVEKLSGTDQRIALTIDAFDTDRDILNTPSGTVSLLDGSIKPCQRRDYCTKIAGAAYGKSPDCPTWRAFLERVQPDEEVRAYLQRVLGYALTGHVTESALFFFYGTGNNGKSTVLNTLVQILGGYAKTVESRLFMESQNERHPTEIASLMGARAIVANEIKQGRMWDEGLIAELTGGTRLTGRYMFSNFFEFWPQLKPFISGNHKPALRGINVAMRRRFHLIPFDIKIPDTEVDKRFQERLRPEYPAILRWMIEGCLIWREIGLVPPKGIVAATDEYFASEDALGDFLKECCESCDINCKQETVVSKLFIAWKAFTDLRNERPGSLKRFSQLLSERGFVRGHNDLGNVFLGLRLTPRLDEPEYIH